MDSDKSGGIHWLPDKEYRKAIGQFSLQMNAVFEPFMCYGLQAFVPGAIKEIVRLAEDFSLRTRGVDKPIDIERVRKGV